ncbi:hypothetical protein DRP04_07430 [Archaeoglobales archaeon]|nr:MAG: hypothetical protein DRP04_07430 [Archaeoglobales archaeon]
MDVVMGGFTSAILAWISIILVTFALRRLNVDDRTFRVFGGFAIASIALIISGVQIPSYTPLILTVTGLILGFLRANRADSSHGNK